MSQKKKTEPLPSVGTKTTRKKVSSTPGPKKTSQTTSVRTAKNLSQNLTTLTTQTLPSKKPSSKQSTNKQQKKSDKIAKTKDSLVYSSDLALFPYVDMFPYRLEDKTEKKTCYFQCENHARKYVGRYKPEYILYCYSRR